MTRRLSFELGALDGAARFLANDAEGLRQVMQAIDDLTDDPLPVGSSPLGSSDLCRLRVGRFRVIYQVTEAAITVIHVGRTAGRDG